MVELVCFNAFTGYLYKVVDLLRKLFGEDSKNKIDCSFAF